MPPWWPKIKLIFFPTTMDRFIISGQVFFCLRSLKNYIDLLNMKDLFISGGNASQVATIGTKGPATSCVVCRIINGFIIQGVYDRVDLSDMIGSFVAQLSASWSKWN